MGRSGGATASQTRNVLTRHAPPGRHWSPFDGKTALIPGTSLRAVRLTFACERALLCPVGLAGCGPTSKAPPGYATTLPRVPTIFGPEWMDLTLDHVQAYLDEADDEPLLWEAKGTKLHKDEIRRQVCAFANSHEGGYLILGAKREPDGRWTLEGAQFPGEPRPWIADVISDLERGVRPRPDFDVVAWEAPAGHVAIVRITPTPTPPCLANGTVYERLPGKSQTVQDPMRLANLFSRGDTARKDAQARADRAAFTVLNDWLDGAAGEFRPRWGPVGDGVGELSSNTDESLHVRFAVGLATTGHAQNVSSRLFREDFATAVWKELAGRPTQLPPGLSGEGPDAIAWAQDALIWRRELTLLVPSITIIRTAWDGSASVGVKQATDDIIPGHLAEAAIAPEWRYTEDLVQRLGAFGDVYLTVVVAGGHFPRRTGTGPIVMRRGPMLLGMTDHHVASLSRELMRALGNPAGEP